MKEILLVRKTNKLRKINSVFANCKSLSVYKKKDSHVSNLCMHGNMKPK